MENVQPPMPIPDTNQDESYLRNSRHASVDASQAFGQNIFKRNSSHVKDGSSHKPSASSPMNAATNPNNFVTFNLNMDGMQKQSAESDNLEILRQ